MAKYIFEDMKAWAASRGWSLRRKGNKYVISHPRLKGMRIILDNLGWVPPAINAFKGY